MSSKFELQQEINRILAQIQQPQLGQQEPNAQEGEQAIHVDKYTLPDGSNLFRFPNGDAVMLPNGAQDETTIVESVPPLTQAQDGEQEEDIPEADTDLHDEQEEYKGPRLARHPLRKETSVSTVMMGILVLVLFATAVMSYFVVAPLLATATITITPQVRNVHTNVTLTVTQRPNAGQVQGRSLDTVSLTKSITVPATGHAHQNATSAVGVITFYNADQQSYTIPAGTSFTAQSGATIVTDNPVMVQAAVPPMFGTAYVSAHVIQAGAEGNLPAHAIYSHCCGNPFLTATNSLFTGGQDAVTYSYVQSSDIQNAANDMMNSLTSQATTTLNKEARTGEALVTPLCSPRTQESAEPGAQAITVTVSVTQTCTAVAYTQDSLNRVATDVLARNVNLTSYQQVGTVQVTVNGSSYSNHTASLKVAVSGNWVYYFSQAELTHLKSLLAGKTQEQAKTMLKKADGVVNVTISLQRLDFSNQLPTNPQHIAIQFFYIVS